MALGVVVLDLGHEPVPGMVAHPDSHPADTRLHVLSSPDLVRRAARADASLLDDVVAAGVALVREGAAAVATSCGYFSVFQRPLSERLPVPVFSSPLLQLPALLATLPPDRSVLVVAAVADGLDDRCLRASGVVEDDRVRVAGMDGPGHFRAAILEHAVPVDAAQLTEQLVDTVAKAAADDATVGAVLLECGEMPVAADALRRTVDLPVYDYATYLDWARASVAGVRS